MLQQRSRPSLRRTMEEYPSSSPLTSAGWETLQPAGRISIDEQHHTASSLCSCVEPVFSRVLLVSCMHDASGNISARPVCFFFAAGECKQRAARLLRHESHRGGLATNAVIPHGVQRASPGDSICTTRPLNRPSRRVEGDRLVCVVVTGVDAMVLPL